MIPKSFLNKFRKAQKRLVLDLSRAVIVGYNSAMVESCPNCFYDSASGSSGAVFTNFITPKVVFAGTPNERTISPKPFKKICPICRGDGNLTVNSEKTIMASVLWESSDPTTNIGTSVGEYLHHWVILKADSKYYGDFIAADYFVVDGVKVDPNSTPYIRSLEVADGIVEIMCTTVDVIEGLHEL
jgi:hypothetical protein